MSSTYGENLHLTIFGQSHSPAIGVTVEGIPAGEKVDLDELQRFLNRRAPGKNVWSTPRKEADAPEILSGLVNGYTCGAPLTAIILMLPVVERADDARERKRAVRELLGK